MGVGHVDDGVEPLHAGDDAGGAGLLPASRQ
jgi:hypothetical protein